MPMFLAATLSWLTATLPLAMPLPQGEGGNPGGASQQPLLSSQEQASLRDKLRKFLADDEDYSLAQTARDREKTSRSREKTKEAFETEWKKIEKKHNLMASMPDLRAIFENCFPRKRPSHSLGILQRRSMKEFGIDYCFQAPKAYRPEETWPTMVVLPSSKAGGQPGEWVKATDYFAEVWDGTAWTNEAIVHVLQPPEPLEFDPVPDYGRENAEVDEDRRNRAVLASFGEIVNSLNVDRARIFLDCGRGMCGYGIRLTTLFPDRFAGLVLRHPTAIDGLRFGSLLGTPILMLRTAETSAVVDDLKKRIEEVSPNSVTVIDAAGAYPHKDSADSIAEWLRTRRRNMSPTRVVVEPNHDRFNRAYWVDIDIADPLVTSADDKKARIEVVADRAANRITVKTVSVERFELLLNDDLVDLDKEFTVVVNDKAVIEKRSRSFRDMLERVVQRSDWDYIFPVRYVTTVPK
jgi:hypothetical protein